MSINRQKTISKNIILRSCISNITCNFFCTIPESFKYNFLKLILLKMIKKKKKNTRKIKNKNQFPNKKITVLLNKVYDNLKN